MSDIVAAVDAALAIEAGKYLLGRLGLPTLLRLRRTRFVDVDGPDVETGGNRLGGFLRKLDERTPGLGDDEAAHRRLEAQFERPEITGSLYAAFEGAMETDDDLKTSTLADLVFARLKAPDESVDGLAARIAIERMRDVSPHQIRLLALTAVLKSERFASRAPMTPEQREAYANWVERALAPFAQIPLDFADFAHLRGLGLLFFDDSNGAFTTTTSLPLLYSALPIGSTQQTDPRVSNAINAVIREQIPNSRMVTVNNVASSTLTPAGLAIAKEALRELAGVEL